MKKLSFILASEMKGLSIFFSIILSICNVFSLHADNELSICKEISDSIWIQWFADPFDTNAEITEMRNEYLFCRLESDNYAEFVYFLYITTDSTNKQIIGKELQHPLNDDIDINKCIYNVKKSDVSLSFKMWLINNLLKKMDQTPQIEGLYVWNPGKYYWILNPDKRKNSEPSQKVWDSLFVYSDNHYIMKSSRYYDVGCKTVKNTIKGSWSNKGEYLSFIPDSVNYSCVPKRAADSIISIQISCIDYEKKDTFFISQGMLYVCAGDGVAIYHSDSTGHVAIKCDTDVWAVCVKSNCEVWIPFPNTECSYNVTLPCYGRCNTMAELFKIKSDGIWSCGINKDRIQLYRQFKKIH